MAPSDPRPPKRICDPEVIRQKVAGAHCRNCQDMAFDGHHILLKSKSGDDHEDNIMPLCRHCHRLYHDGNITLRVTLDERLYVLTKLGQVAGTDYLERRRYVA